MPTDELSQKYAQALERARLDDLLPLVRHLLPLAPGPAFTLLRLIFEQAQQANLSLLSPGEGFHEWILHAARQNQNGKPASANTVRLRLSLLSNIYAEAVRLDLIPASPLLGLQRPPNERQGAPLLSREVITHLSKEVQPYNPGIDGSDDLSSP